MFNLKASLPPAVERMTLHSTAGMAHNHHGVIARRLSRVQHLGPLQTNQKTLALYTTENKLSSLEGSDFFSFFFSAGI